MAYKAFVSSTFQDLERHRARAIATLRRSGFQVDPMEEWTASSQPPAVFSPDRLDGCDLCVLLIARRRGHVPRGGRRSITQLEVAEAVERDIDVLAFMLADDATWPAAYDELADDAALRRWRADLLETRGVARFGRDPRSLDIAPALARWIAERQRTELSAGHLPEEMPWSPKAIRLGRQCGMLVFEGEIEFADEVAESLRDAGDDWIRGGPVAGSTRVAANWTDYSTMAIVDAISLGELPSERDQDLVLLEGQPQLIRWLLELALQTGVMDSDGGELSVAHDLNEEMLELFENPPALSDYFAEDGEPRDAAMLAFVDMVRARLMLRQPGREAFAEALGTLVLSTFGFWGGPGNAGRDIAS